MSDLKVEAVRCIIDNFRRTRRARTVPYPDSIKRAVISLIGGGQSIPRISKQISISHVLIYQWQKEAREGQLNPAGLDPFIELPVESSLDSSVPHCPMGVMEIRRDKASAVMRIECPVEWIGLVVQEFLGGMSAC